MPENHILTFDPDDGTYRCAICARRWKDLDDEMIHGACKPPETSFTVKVIGYMGPDGILHPMPPVPLGTLLYSIFHPTEESGTDLLSQWVEGEGSDIVSKWIEEGGIDE